MLIEFKADGWEGETGSKTLRKGEDPEGRFTLTGMEHSLLQQPTQEKGLLLLSTLGMSRTSALLGSHSPGVRPPEQLLREER